MIDFDEDKPLLSLIVIKYAENHLFRFRFSVFSFGSQIRKRFNNPLFILFIICVQILKSITAIIIKEDKHRLLLIGDFNHFLNARYFMNLAKIPGVVWLYCHKSKIMFEFSRNPIIGICFTCFFFSRIPLIINSSFELY
jgi:hypothetical protein